MYQFGGTLDDALAFTRIMGEGASVTHPARKLRIDAIKRGYQAAKAQEPQVPAPRPSGRGWWADLTARKLPWVN